MIMGIDPKARRDCRRVSEAEDEREDLGMSLKARLFVSTRASRLISTLTLLLTRTMSRLAFDMYQYSDSRTKDSGGGRGVSVGKADQKELDDQVKSSGCKVRTCSYCVCYTSRRWI